MKFLSEHDFEYLAKKHHIMQKIEALQEYTHLLAMVKSITSCVNGREHGSFITAICAGEIEHAKNCADAVNIRFIDFYLDVVKTLRE